LGGTLTNFPEIKKRIARLEDLTTQREKGELAKYTKKERLLIDREIIKLEHSFGGISSMRFAPKALFVIDPKREHIAVAEAKKLNIPVVALASSDCDIRGIDYPILGNDASQKSIEYFVNQIVDAILEGKRIATTAPAVSDTPKQD
jgi:small subunit ribosomal protein S2